MGRAVLPPPQCRADGAEYLGLRVGPLPIQGVALDVPIQVLVQVQFGAMGVEEEKVETAGLGGDS